MTAEAINESTLLSPPKTAASSLRALMTRERWIEVGRIFLAGLTALLYWQQWVPLQILWVAVAIGLYPLVKTGKFQRRLEPGPGNITLK